MENTTKPFDGPITKNGLKLQRFLKKGDGFVRLISPARIAQDIKEAKREAIEIVRKRLIEAIEAMKDTP
jgi:hypothetical protein